jgi:hypothetical protein
MKITRIILNTLGILCIVFNLIGLIAFGYNKFVAPPGPIQNKIGYYMGVHAFIIIGITMLVIAWALRRRKKTSVVREEDIHSIGNNIAG